MFIISKKDNRFLRDFGGYFPIMVRTEVLLRKPVIGIPALTVVKSQTDLKAICIPDRPIQVFLLQKSQFEGFFCCAVDLIRPVAHPVDAGFQGSADGFRVQTEIMMHVGDLCHCPAVSHCVEETILILQNALHLRVENSRHTVDPVIGRHHARCTAFRDNSPERLEIELIPVARINARILPSSASLRIVSIKMLERCSAANVIRVFSLHSFDIG